MQQMLKRLSFPWVLRPIPLSWRPLELCGRGFRETPEWRLSQKGARGIEQDFPLWPAMRLLTWQILPQSAGGGQE